MGRSAPHWRDRYPPLEGVGIEGPAKRAHAAGSCGGPMRRAHAVDLYEEICEFVAAPLVGIGVKGLYSYTLAFLTGSDHEGTVKRETHVRTLQSRPAQGPRLRDLQQSAPQATPGLTSIIVDKSCRQLDLSLFFMDAISRF